MTRMVYLAYPIDQVMDPASYADLMNLINQVKEDLIGYGCTDIVFDPGDAFSIDTDAKSGPEIETINRVALRMADAVVAFLPERVATWGVPAEIALAIELGKSVAVLSNAQGVWSFAPNGDNVIRASMDYTGRDAVLAWMQARPTMAVEPELDLLPVKFLPGFNVAEPLPRRSYDDDAGLDLIVAEDRVIDPGEAIDVPSGVAVQLPDWSWGLIIGRSSTRRLRGLLVHPSVIDSGWRGDMFALVENLTSEPVLLRTGERVAQLIVLPNLTRDLVPVVVPELSPHPRGQQGFGSSGQ